METIKAMTPETPSKAPMKFTPRKLGEAIPARLILKPNGTLAMVDGSSPAEYLKSVRRAWKMRGNIEVVIGHREAIQRLEGEALMMRNWGA